MSGVFGEEVGLFVEVKDLVVVEFECVCEWGVC